MSSIRERIGSDGKKTYNVMIRKRGIEICKTFLTREDAELYSFYKERLIQNMENFDVDIKERITFRQIMELKRNSLSEDADHRTKLNFKTSLERIENFLPKDKFVNQISYEDWLECCKKVFEMDVYLGGRTERCKRKMSVKTLRNIFAYASSAFTYAQAQGIAIENHPMQIMKTFINGLQDK